MRLLDVLIGALFPLVAAGVGLTASVSVDGSVVAKPPLLRSEVKDDAASSEDLCREGEMCTGNKCTSQTFLTAQCMATSEGSAACLGSQVCTDKSTKDSSGNVLAQFKCCCPACESSDSSA
mmetsp:Transcript_9239/g.17007  ORF Transcript_9239/g.17007 Transcript_9239/m.17007 type:complete len:121 (-) Transcript_9239:74-436(-)